MGSSVTGETVPSRLVSDDIPIEACTLRADDGVELEAECRLPDDATGAVLLAHPHPLFGGSMRSLVTSELFRLLPAAGLAALRFNFRGVEGSGGTHGGGRTEALDVVVGIAALAARAPDVALVAVGWSFGADVSISVTDERIAGWCLIAPPMRILPPGELRGAHDPRPKLLLVPEHDEFNPPDAAAERSSDWSNTTLEVVRGADHYLAGRTALVAEAVQRFVADRATERSG